MAFTKRMKSSLIQGASANLLFFVLFLGGIFYYLIPQIKYIEDKKASLVDAYNTLQRLEKSGPQYADIQKFVAGSDEFRTEFYTVLLENVSEEFYDEFFLNETDTSYNDFLQSYERKLSEKKERPEIVKRDEIINELIPYYSEGDYNGEESLSDFHFINYVENLLYSFNVSSQWDIWIWDLEVVEVFSKEENSLFNNEIFKIPLSFQLVWRKVDVLDFIHFFENVGSIEVEKNTIQVYNDAFMSKSIEGDESSGREYSVYNNQISDIETITFQNYLDSSSLRSSGNLIERVRRDQSREGISVEVALNFYVAGIPGYKMREEINSFFEIFDQVSENINNDASQYRLQVSQDSSGAHIQAINGLEGLASLMWPLWLELAQMRDDTWDVEDIWELYKEVSVYQKQFTRIQESYNLYLETLSK